MNCIGCNDPLTDETVAAFAIMDAQDFGTTPMIKGPGRFHASPVCQPCFDDPSHRKRNLKAHFALPHELPRMLGAAGSSTQIG